MRGAGRGGAATCAFVALLASVAIPRLARATPSARLVYVRDAGAEDCPDEAALRAAVATRLGYDPFFPHAKSTLFAEVTREGTTYRARVKLVDEGNVVRGARELKNEGGRCADLVDGMALTMSIAIDPRSLAGPVAPDATEPEAPEPEPPPPSPEPLATPPTPPPAPGPATRDPAERAELVHGALFAYAALHLGAAPSAAVGVLPGFELRYRSLALEAAGRVDARASRDVTQGTVSTSFTAASLAPCIVRGFVRACGVVTVGSLTASARGITTPREDAGVHTLLGLRLGVVVPLGPRFDLRALVDLAFAATPQVLRIDGQDVYSLPTVSGSFGLGVDFRLF